MKEFALVICLTGNLQSFPFASDAAIDGALGTSSTADTDSNNSIPALLRISGFSELSASSTGSGDPGVVSETPLFCQQDCNSLGVFFSEAALVAVLGGSYSVTNTLVIELE